MSQFFEPVVKKNVRLVSRLLKKSNAKLILVAGGFSKSPYLMEALKNKFHDKTVTDVAPSVAFAPHPVARGVPLRYQDVIDVSVAATDCFGISQDELFDRDRHPDGVHEKGNWIPSARGGYVLAKEGDINYNVVKLGKYDDELWVHERWVTLMKPGEAGPNEVAVWQWDFIEEENDDKPLTCRIYWTKNTIPDGSPIQIWGGEGGMRREVMHWGSPLKVAAPDWYALGFQKHCAKKDDGRNIWGYQIFWRIKMMREGGNVSLLWELAPYSKEMPPSDFPSAQMILLAQDLIVDQVFNPNARN